jgi:F0F1-type ATP synthase delta subunit
MKKNVIKKLAEQSFKKDNLDEKLVMKVAKNLKREDLKVYIKDLKNISAQKTVTVTIPSSKGASDMKKYFDKIYPGKRIVFKVDESLLTGIKVVDYDNVYELSLKGVLEHSLRGATND